MYTCLLFCDLRNYWIRRNAKQELQNDRIPNLFSLYLLLQLALTYIEEMIFISMCRIQQRKIENPRNGDCRQFQKEMENCSYHQQCSTWKPEADSKQMGNCRLNSQQFPTWNRGAELTAGVFHLGNCLKGSELALDITICQIKLAHPVKASP